MQKKVPVRKIIFIGNRERKTLTSISHSKETSKEHGLNKMPRLLVSWKPFNDRNIPLIIMRYINKERCASYLRDMELAAEHQLTN